MWFSRLFNHSKQTGRELEVRNFMKNAFGVNPGSMQHYMLALVHSSSTKKNAEGIRKSNERLEFLGDAILDAVVAEYLYENFPKTTEGELTKLKSKIVSRRFLNNVGLHLGIKEMLIINLGNQPMHNSLIGNAFEALVGAIYLDKGYEYTHQRILKILSDQGMQKNLHIVTDFKSKLHEWCQKNKKQLRFVVLSEEQIAGSSAYVIEVQVDGGAMGTGKGKSKKAAEQKASEKACQLIFEQ